MDPLTVARLEEASHARSARAIAAESMEIGTGVATFSAPGSWLNQAWNMGLHGPVSGDELDAMVGFFRERSVDPMLPVCTLADASLVTGLAARGFTLTDFNNVYAADLGDVGLEQPVPWPTGLRIEVVDSSDDAQAELWVQTSASGFHDGAEPPAAMVQASRGVVRQPGNIGMMAFVDDQPAGAGIVAISDDTIKLAGLFGTSVLPPFRGRGIQQLLMFERLQLAARRGAVIATIASRPGIPTERNAVRAGFELSYVKAVMTQPDITGG